MTLLHGNPTYRIHGTGRDFILLLCGFQATQTCWRLVLPWIGPCVATITLDNRGAGAAPFAGEALSLEEMAQDALRVVDQLGVKRVFIAGHSMGGAIAQLIARRYPERVRALALCNSFRKLGDESTIVLTQLCRDLDAGCDPGQVWRRLAGEFFASGPLRQAAAELIGRNLAARGRAMANGFRCQLEALTAFDSRPWLHEITAPVLIVHSQDDRPSLAAETVAMASQLRKSHYLQLPGGHMSMVEQPRALGRALASFFIRHGVAT